MSIKLISEYSDLLPKLKYNKEVFRILPNLKWGQRKLLITEVDFLTRYYDCYRKNEKKYLLYVGASPGQHINYLKILFPDINYILYDKVDSKVEPSQNVVFHQRYFDDNEAKKYIGMNIFFICDIRNLSVEKHLINMRKSENSNSNMDDQIKSTEIILDDMKMQKDWCLIMKPIQSHLKFRVSWNTSVTEYFDGKIFFQPWTGNGSIEMRIIPNLSSTKLWNNKTIEEVCFYYNVNIRHKLIGDKYHETLLEEQILKSYITKFIPEKKEELEATTIDLSISISIFLMKILNRRTSVSKKYLFDVSSVL